MHILTKCVLPYYNLIDFCLFILQLQDIQCYPSSERFYDQTISGKLIANGKPFTVDEV